MTQQVMFGGFWTQQKLRVLSKYLKAYRRIFDRNERARYFKTIYVDAFAGTGVIPMPEAKWETFEEFVPYLAEVEEEFRKGSVRRALEVQPPFHEYIFIEKSTAKCEELLALKKEFPDRSIEVVNRDANTALLNWCRKMNTQRERAVVFLDPFGASVEWKVIEAMGQTRAVDLWILFPYAAINRMLTKHRRPPPSWTDRLTRVFGTDEWQGEFYESAYTSSIIEPDEEIEFVRKTADQIQVGKYFMKRLRTVFAEVAQPGPLFNSKGILFLLFFATGNATGVKIANDLLRDLAK